MAEYEHIVNLRENLFNANSVVYLVVMIWWIACLWIDEPGTAVAVPASGAQDTEKISEAETGDA